MSDRISLTAAELAFLLSVSGGAAGSPGPRLLGLTAGERTDALVAAGVGSLLLRHLAAPVSEHQVELAPAVAAVAEGLARPRLTVQLGLVAAERADGGLLFDTGSVRFLVAPRAFRCFDVTGVDPALDRRDPLMELAHSFLQRHRPGVASFNVLAGDRLAGWTTVTATADGTWTFVAGRDEAAARSGLTADHAMEYLYEELGALAGEPALLR